MKGLKFITISGYDWKAEVCPSVGMNTISLSYNGRAIFHSPILKDIVSVSYTSNGNQLLFPANRTAGAKFEFEGVTYNLPVTEPRYNNNLHGKLKSSDFTVKSRSATRVRGEYINIGDIFPFPCIITVECRIEEDGYHQSFSFKNTGAKNMPLSFGLHTNFEAPDNFSIPIGSRWEINDIYVPTGKLVELCETEKLYTSGSPSKGFRISNYYTSTGNTAKIDELLYTVSDNFNQWILFNSDGTKGFLSIEPQCGAVNGLNSGEGIKIVKPGQTETFSTWIHVNK